MRWRLAVMSAKRDFLAQQQRAADLRGSDAGCGHGWWGNVVPATDNEVFCAAGNIDTALLVDVREIAAVDQTLPDGGAVEGS